VADAEPLERLHSGRQYALAACFIGRKIPPLQYDNGPTLLGCNDGNRQSGGASTDHREIPKIR
jgi:hypothetical protein